MHRLILLTLLLSINAYASTPFDELIQRNKIDTSSENGEKFEMKAVASFWGSPHFMMQCLPPGSPLHDPFTILFEVLSDGGMGELVFSENDHVTKCISNNVRNRNFPKPQKPFVVRIDLKFTE